MWAVHAVIKAGDVSVKLIYHGGNSIHKVLLMNTGSLFCIWMYEASLRVVRVVNKS